MTDRRHLEYVGRHRAPEKPSKLKRILFGEQPDPPEPSEPPDPALAHRLLTHGQEF